MKGSRRALDRGRTVAAETSLRRRVARNSSALLHNPDDANIIVSYHSYICCASLLARAAMKRRLPSARALQSAKISISGVPEMPQLPLPLKPACLLLHGNGVVEGRRASCRAMMSGGGSASRESSWPVYRLLARACHHRRHQARRISGRGIKGAAWRKPTRHHQYHRPS